MKRLYRSRDERMFAGVAGGIAEYFGIDPTVVRAGFVLFTLAGGWGLLAYLILAVIMPLEPAGKMVAPGPGTTAEMPRHEPSVAETRKEVQESRVPERIFRP